MFNWKPIAFVCFLTDKKFTILEIKEDAIYDNHRKVQKETKREYNRKQLVVILEKVVLSLLVTLMLISSSINNI